MYFQRWKGILFVSSVILLAMVFTSCEYSTKEKEAIDQIADELIKKDQRVQISPPLPRSHLPLPPPLLPPQR